MNKHTDLKGWSFSGDINWSDYGGEWVRKSGSKWYALTFFNWNEHDVSYVEEGGDAYVCEVKVVDIANLPADELVRALACVGMSVCDDGLMWDNGDVVAPEHVEEAEVRACLAYGLYATIDTFTDKSYPLRARGKARACACELMRDGAMLEDKLDEQANAFGNSKRDFMSGNIGFKRSV
jgi:hypothetical protein